MVDGDLSTQHLADEAANSVGVSGRRNQETRTQTRAGGAKRKTGSQQTGEPQKKKATTSKLCFNRERICLKLRIII